MPPTSLAFSCSSRASTSAFASRLWMMSGLPQVRAQAIQVSSYKPQERYILFVFSVEYAFMNTYDEGNPGPRRWQSKEAS